MASLHEAFQDAVSERFSDLVSTARANGGPLTRSALSDMAARAARDRVAATGLGGVLAIMAERPDILDRAVETIGNVSVRVLVEGLLVEDATLALEDRVEAELSLGQDADTLPAAVGSALAAIDEALASARAAYPHRAAAEAILSDTSSFDTPLYAAFANGLATALREAGAPMAGDRLQAAFEGRGAVMLRGTPPMP